MSTAWLPKPRGSGFLFGIKTHFGISTVVKRPAFNMVDLFALCRNISLNYANSCLRARCPRSLNSLNFILYNCLPCHFRLVCRLLLVSSSFVIITLRFSFRALGFPIVSAGAETNQKNQREAPAHGYFFFVLFAPLFECFIFCHIPDYTTSNSYYKAYLKEKSKIVKVLSLFLLTFLQIFSLCVTRLF